MSKIFEALETARGSSTSEPGLDDLAAFRPDVADVAASAAAPVSPAGMDMEEEVISLYQRLHALPGDETYRVLQFIGSREGEGASTVASEFARVSASRFGQRVLLLEMGRRPNLRSHRDVGFDDSRADFAPARVEDTQLFVAPLLRSVSHPTDSRSGASTWRRLRKDYDLVLVDSLPASASAEGFAISSHVDGVILVLEAEKTRWPVAERVKERIERSGGRVLGIVFNKRRYHIPPFIYRLF